MTITIRGPLQFAMRISEVLGASVGVIQTCLLTESRDHVTIGYLGTLIRTARYAPADTGQSLSRAVEDAWIRRRTGWTGKRMR